MGKLAIERSTGIVLLSALVTFLAALMVLMWMGLDTWVITWLAVLAGCTIGMAGGMVLLILAMEVENVDGTSS